MVFDTILRSPSWARIFPPTLWACTVMDFVQTSIEHFTYLDRAYRALYDTSRAGRLSLEICKSFKKAAVDFSPEWDIEETFKYRPLNFQVQSSRSGIGLPMDLLCCGRVRAPVARTLPLGRCPLAQGHI